MINKTNWFDLSLEILLVCMMVIIIALSAFLLFGVSKIDIDCKAHGGKLVVDHYVTTYISTDTGPTTVLIPTDTPIYKCIDQ